MAAQRFMTSLALQRSHLLSAMEDRPIQKPVWPPPTCTASAHLDIQARLPQLPRPLAFLLLL